MAEMGRLESQVSKESLDDPDQWEPQETRDRWETRDLRDHLECQDPLGHAEILVKTDLQEFPDLLASLDQQEREEWLAHPGPGGSRGCPGHRGKMESRAGTEPLVCRDRRV